MPGWENITSRLLDYNDNLSGLGMRSILHKYQRRTVAAMMQRELDLRDVPTLIYSVEDNSWEGVLPSTRDYGGILERPLVAPWRGGILCEEYRKDGNGSRSHPLNVKPTSHPEESIVEDRPVLTPISFTYFPSSECINARRRFFRDALSLPPEVKIPSLTEILIDRICTTKLTSIPDLRTPSGEAIKHNVPFYHHYLEEPTNREREHRAGFSYSYKKSTEGQGPRIMYLSGATLVVVPGNLFSQWAREIVKHCEDGRIRVLTLTSGTKMPDVKELAGMYDIVLMTYTRYTAEANFSAVQSTSISTRSCKCPTFPGTRILNCVCPVETNHTSPLLHVRWKRLVIDEGHVSGMTQTTLVEFTRQLSIERRWIVTGTPTAGLLGLSFGSGGGKKDDNEEELEISFRSSPSPPSPPSPPTSLASSPVPAQTRIWTKYDRSDLNKLGNMMSDFIGIPQFRADPSLVTTHIIEPLMDRSGPRPGAIEVLRRVMEDVMIRHRIQDVEEEVLLPPIKHESVLLDLDPLAIKSYNALQATIAINAIDSQRTDQDYMFHPRNVEYLQLTVANMSQLMFWSVDERLYNVDQLVEDAQVHIDRALDRNAPPEDMELLYNAFKHVRLAANDPTWRAINTYEDVAYHVYNMNLNVFDTWSRVPSTDSLDEEQGYVGLMHADRLLRLHDMIISHPLIKEDQLLIQGKVVRMDDVIAKRKSLEELQKKKSRSKKGHNGGNGALGEEDGRKSTMKVPSQEIMKKIQKELMASLEALERNENDEEADLPRTEKPSILVASSLLARVRVRNSASSKLNYIINEVLKYSPTEKFIIFSESVLSLAHIAEALRLVKVKFIHFTTQIEPQSRQQLILTFETSETYRVLLMELRHGARGLNLISASRVIFCEPVWQADVESQAIKRAHRIGQTKPITVKTLAIRGTAEENMVSRRNALKDSPEKLPKLIEEAGMRHFIANPKFIGDPPKDLPQVSFKLFNIPGLESAVENPSGLTIRIPPLPSPKSLPRKRIRADDTSKTSATMMSSSSSKQPDNIRSILKKPTTPAQRHVTIVEPILGSQVSRTKKRVRLEEPDEDDVLPMVQTPVHSPCTPITLQPLRSRTLATGSLRGPPMHLDVNQTPSPTLMPLPFPKRANDSIQLPRSILKQSSQSSSSSKHISFAIPSQK
ncbi:hypothetical protein BDQ17DRAFT_1536631 [Cyathus striatus]|nr:hypothetical protein BDQ17DRAFT_1536631 [Cyathus striatus]